MTFPLCYSQSPLLTDCTPPPPPPSLLNKIKIGLKLFRDGSLKSESSEIMPRNLNEIIRS
jgi:hypothetical protein